MILILVLWLIYAILLMTNILLKVIKIDKIKEEAIARDASYFGLGVVILQHSIIGVLLLRSSTIIMLLVAYIISANIISPFNAILFFIGATIFGYLLYQGFSFYYVGIRGVANSFKESNFLFNAKNGDTYMIKHHIKKGINVNCKDNIGNSALILAVINGHIEIVDMLLKNGAKVDEKDCYDNTTPLFMAIRNGNTKIVKCLVENGASLDQIDVLGSTPLLAAVYGNKNNELIKYLINAGSDVNYQMPSDGQTALMAATYFDNKEVTNLLLSNGANINATDFRGLTAYDYIRHNNN